MDDPYILVIPLFRCTFNHIREALKRTKDNDMHAFVYWLVKHSDEFVDIDLDVDFS